jgi:hypothetical protein
LRRLPSKELADAVRIVRLMLAAMCMGMCGAHADDATKPTNSAVGRSAAASNPSPPPAARAFSQKSGKKRLRHEVFTDFTANSFTQTGDIGEAGAALNRWITIHATRVAPGN